MSFVFDGVLIESDLPDDIRQLLVSKTYRKQNKKYGRIDVVKRVSYYDPVKQFNVAVGSKKIGEIDPKTNEVRHIIRRKSPTRAKLNDALLELSDKAEKKISDKRQTNKIVYELPVVLDIALLAALGECRGSKAMRDYWENNLPALRERWGSDLPKTVPSTTTMNRLLQIICPSQLEHVYQDFVFPLLPMNSTESTDPDIVAIDGQAIRASRTETGRQHQMLSFYSTESGIAFCQVHIDVKSNEKPAALALAHKLDLRGTIVTGDAMHCDRKLIKTLVTEAGADYCVALKLNQSKSIKAVIALFESHSSEVLVGIAKDKGHGRREMRTTYVLPGSFLPEEIREKWYGIELGTIVKQVSVRSVIRGDEVVEQSEQVRYYLCSLSPDCADIVRNVERAVRQHWGIENNLHHVLDVDFGQDFMQAKNPNYITNVAQLLKFALSVVEIIRRKHIKEGRMKESVGVKEILRRLHNNPKLAGDYLDEFVGVSCAAKASRQGDPLTVN